MADITLSWNTVPLWKTILSSQNGLAVENGCCNTKKCWRTDKGYYHLGAEETTNKEETKNIPGNILATKAMQKYKIIIMIFTSKAHLKGMETSVFVPLAFVFMGISPPEHKVQEWGYIKWITIQT